jgi:hypothetical protein
VVLQCGPEPGLSTREWLSRWLASRVSLRASTSRGYAAHMRSYLVPYLGGIPLAALTAGDVQAMFTAVIQDEGALGRAGERGDAAPDPRHAQRRGPCRADQHEPGPLPGAAQGRPAPAVRRPGRGGARRDPGGHCTEARPGAGERRGQDRAGSAAGGRRPRRAEAWRPARLCPATQCPATWCPGPGRAAHGREGTRCVPPGRAADRWRAVPGDVPGTRGGAALPALAGLPGTVRHDPPVWCRNCGGRPGRGATRARTGREPHARRDAGSMPPGTWPSSATARPARRSR